jgi:hypothetical protein
VLASCLVLARSTVSKPSFRTVLSLSLSHTHTHTHTHAHAHGGSLGSLSTVPYSPGHPITSGCRRYGKIDRAILWPTYTNLGIDDRNQFELSLSCPGGAEGLSVVIDQLHARGVRVLWAYNPWDRSTHGQIASSQTDMQALAELMKATGADGFNGDTMGLIPQSYYDAYGTRFPTEIYTRGMSLVPRLLALLGASRRVVNGIPLGCLPLVPVHAVNYVQTLKGGIIRSWPRTVTTPMTSHNTEGR